MHKIIAIHSFPTWLPQTQTWMYNQIKYLPQDRVESHVVCDVTEHLEQFAVPNIHCLGDASRLQLHVEKVLRKLAIPVSGRFLTGIAKKYETDIVHSHFGNIGWIDRKAASRVGSKHIVTFYGYDVKMLPTENKKWFLRYRELFRSANLFLCEGPHMRMELIGMGAPAEKVKVQHLGVEIEKISYIPRQWQKADPFRVLIAASFQEKKGIPYALEALAHIQDEISLEITIIGDANREQRSQQEKNRIIEIIEKCGLASKTSFLGYQPYSVLFQEAYKHHVFISPSVTAANGDTEGGAPVVLIEMMATGMPVVSTTHCDIPNVVQYDVENWLVNERDVAGLVGRLRWLIENPGGWRDMLDVGRTRVEKEFNVRSQGQRLAKIYSDLVVI